MGRQLRSPAFLPPFFLSVVAATQNRRRREFQACGLIINMVKPGSMLRIRKEKPEG